MSTPLPTAVPCVLVVDSSEETRAVLQTALARRGIEVLAAERAEQGLAMARERRPQLIVLDLEIADRSACATRDEWEAAFAAESDEGGLVVLGTAHRSGDAGSPERFVAKPYHYGPLIRRIEALLERPAGMRRAA